MENEKVMNHACGGISIFLLKKIDKFQLNVIKTFDNDLLSNTF